MTAFKIISVEDWAAFKADGRYAGSAVDLADGYIHMSTAAQAAETARKHYAGRDGLMLLTVDLTALGDALVWEPSRGGDLFPHHYADLPLSAVMASQTFAVDADGTLRFEGEAPSWA